MFGHENGLKDMSLDTSKYVVRNDTFNPVLEMLSPGVEDGMLPV